MNVASIHKLVPLEQGGPVARIGFIYQDHVAARFCIEMLFEGKLAEVWCETEDDITLLWGTSSSPLVEFVQVKSDHLQQLWSPALICQGGEEDSIVAKSLQHDRCSEPCIFRIVTRGEVNAALEPLKFERDHEERSISNAAMLAAHQVICKAMKDKVSPNGRSASHWVADTRWDVSESETALKNANLHKLGAYLEAQGEVLFSDQCAELYDRLLRLVQIASSQKWVGNGKEKKITRDALVQWVSENAAIVRGQAPTKASVNLHHKMNLAKIPLSTIDTADDLRRSYRRKTLSPSYQSEPAFKEAELEVTAVLQELVSQLDAGQLPDDGVQFHTTCLASLHNVQRSYPAVTLSFLQGVLYSITDRCRHRFRRATL